MRIAIVGAGLTGLSAAYQLAPGARIDVFEAADEVGGLARGFKLHDEQLERYYHHIFTHDTTFIDYAHELGVGDLLEWLPSRMATYAHGRLYPFMTPLDLLRFSPLTPLQRVRFGVAALIARGIKNYEPLEDESAERWLKRLFGAAGYREVWEPLLRKKFGEHTADVAAVWMWGKIALRGSSRERGKERELLGYMRGSFQVFHDKLADACRNRGCAIQLSTPVTGLGREGGRWSVNGGPAVYDQVLVTLPPRLMVQLVRPYLDAGELQRLEQLTFQGAMVALLELDRPLTPYYWINVNDDAIPFGGVIEHTNLLPPERYGGSHVVYLSRYLSPDEPLFAEPSAGVLEQFYAALPAFNPAFERGWVRQAWVFRDAYAQPVVSRRYRERMPTIPTSAAGLFLANMNHIFPEDRGMNYALALGKQAAAAMRQEKGPG